MKNGNSSTETSLPTDLQAIKESYDNFPYVSYPFSKSHPAHLRTTARFLGLQAPALEQAKVLELGCASGGNIIPFAVQYPQAHAVGVDLSEVHIDQGNALIKHLNITNVNLIACSITEIDESFGQFDYIIAHGVYSWVTDEVRDKILTICKKNLAPNGVAYISYNTLPGWNTLATIRDMALFHSRNFEKPEDKIQQTKSLLSFVNDAIKGSNHAYAKLMMESVNLLKNKPDYYIAHDFLELNNKAFYFSHFVDDARAHGLQYLSDVEISNMYIHNYPDSISAKLGEIPDVVRMEQYLDFVTNKTFRSTLLCHDTVEINRDIDVEIASLFHYRMDLSLADEANESILEAGIKAKFYFDNDPTNTISAEDPILKALLYVFSENKGYVFYDNLLKQMVDILPGFSEQEVQDQAAMSLIDLFLRGRMKVSMNPAPVQTTSIEKPKAWFYARTQADYLKNNYVTNLYHEITALSIVEMYLIRYMDGLHTKEQILDQILLHVKNNELEIYYGGKKLMSDEKLKTVIALAYLDAIERFSRNGLLVV